MIAGGAAAGVVAPLEPNLLEEGIVVHIAERLAGGETLYSDIAIHTGPLPYEFLGLLFRLFGAQIELARVVVVLMHGLATGAVYSVARRSAAGPLAHAAAAVVAVTPILLFPMFSLYYYTNLAFDLGWIAVLAALRGLESTRWALVCGVLVAATALCKQSTGFVFAVALLPVFAHCVRKPVRASRVASFVAGGGATAAVVLAAEAARGALADFVHSQISFPAALAGKDSFQLPLMNLWPPGSMSDEIREAWILYLPNLYYFRAGIFADIGPGIIAATQFFYALPFFALIATLLFCVARSTQRGLKLNAVFLLAMTANLIPQGDWGHLVVALPPAMVQLFLLASYIPTRLSRGLRLQTGLAVVSVTLALGSASAVGSWLWSISGPATFGPRVPLRPVSPANLQPAVPRVVAYLRDHTRVGDEIVVPRGEPLLYFATETKNPTRFAGSFPGMREMLEPEYLSALERVDYVVSSDIDTPGYNFAQEVPTVEAYLERHFSVPTDFIVDDTSWLVVLQRGKDRGETAIDLSTEQQHRRAWVRDRDDVETTLSRSLPELRTRMLNRPLAIPLGAHGGGLDFELEIPPRAVFQAGIGLHRVFSVAGPIEQPADISFSISVRTTDEFVRLGSIRVGPLHTQTRWTPFEVDLSRFQGQRVTLRLESSPGSSAPAAGAFAWMGSPRIALQ